MYLLGAGGFSPSCLSIRIAPLLMSSLVDTSVPVRPDMTLSDAVERSVNISQAKVTVLSRKLNIVTSHSH